VFPGSVAWVRELREAGIKTAVVSSSRNCAAVLNYAGISDLFDTRVDGDTALELQLSGKPTPDTCSPNSASPPSGSGGAGGLVLVLNSGSSSVKFALLAPASGERILAGIAEKVGTPEAELQIRRYPDPVVTEQLPEGSYQAVISRILGHLPDAGLETAADEASGHLIGAGHRVVHGGERFTASVLVDDEVIAAIRSSSHLAPLHNPANLAGIEAVRAVRPGLPQVAVFDTAFHQTMPRAAFRYAVPEPWYTRYGVRRYGFHGTSYRFVTARTAELLE